MSSSVTLTESELNDRFYSKRSVKGLPTETDVLTKACILCQYRYLNQFESVRCCSGMSVNELLDIFGAARTHWASGRR